MAAEAVYKLKEAEEKALEMVKNANEKAKSIIEAAETEGSEKVKSILKEAQKAKQDLIENSINQANNDCVPLLSKNEEEISKIKNPDNEKFLAAVKIVTERIVRVSGNS